MFELSANKVWDNRTHQGLYSHNNTDILASGGVHPWKLPFPQTKPSESAELSHPHGSFPPCSSASVGDDFPQISTKGHYLCYKFCPSVHVYAFQGASLTITYHVKYILATSIHSSFEFSSMTEIPNPTVGKKL